jgi:myo-inositol catabolism protein IolC
MSRGYNHPLYLLPFDHRHSYESKMFHFTPPLTDAQRASVGDSKQLIYEGFLQALSDGVPASHAGILVDEEFGAPILRDAAARKYVTAMPVEKSGQDEFEFEYGDAFRSHLDAFHPVFAKALVRYNPEDDAALNQRQRQRLRQLSDYCAGSGLSFMFELLVPATPAQLARAGQGAAAYDRRIRPALMRQAITELQEAGVEPDVWKIEGLDSVEDCRLMVETARRGGRDGVGCIVLGRGADESKVRQWLETAACVPGFTGFAVGRTTFWDAVQGYEAGKLPRPAAASLVARRYSEWVGIFQKAKTLAGRPPQA